MYVMGAAADAAPSASTTAPPLAAQQRSSLALGSLESVEHAHAALRSVRPWWKGWKAATDASDTAVRSARRAKYERAIGESARKESRAALGNELSRRPPPELKVHKWTVGRAKHA